jgi:hypothetical protein
MVDNKPKFETVAEEILEPVEVAYAKLANLAWQSDTSVGLNPEYAKRKIQEIAKEMNDAMALVRYNVEDLLGEEFPDEVYDGYDSACDDDVPFDGGGRPRKDLDIYAGADEEEK